MTRPTKKIAQEPQVISLRDLLETVLLNLRMLCIFVSLFFVLGVLYAYFKTPVFQSRALLQVSKSASGGASLLSQLGSAGSILGSNNVNQAVASQQYIFGSRSVLQTAVLKYHLNIVVTPWHFPIIGTAFANYHDQKQQYVNAGPVKPPMGISRYSWGGDQIIVNQFTAPELSKGKNFTLIYVGNNQYQLLSDHKIILTGTVGQLATATNSAFSLLITKISAYPNTHFSIKKLSMFQAIKRLEKKMTVIPAGVQTNLLRLKITGLVNENLPFILNSVIDNAISLNIQTRMMRAQKVLSFINDQLPLVRQRLNQINAKLSTMLPMGAAYANLMQEKNLQNLIYNNLLLDAQRYELTQASSLGNVSVLIPPTPIFSAQLLPNWLLAILITVCGLLLGITFIFARHYLMGVVFDAEQIEQTTGLSLLTGLQKIKAQTQQVVLFKKERIPYLKLLSELPNSDIALEGFRSLRTALLVNYFMPDGTQATKNNIITIGGPTPNIGKSFVAVNFAQQLAEAGKRTLLIDADLRKGSIGDYFEHASDKKGLLDLIKESSSIETCILKTRFAQLDVILSGELQSRNAELLFKTNIQQILNELSSQYDFVVIDTAPILLVNDALSICRHAAVNLLTLGYGKHNEREIDMTVTRFEKSGIALHGFVMNFMPVPKLGYGYGYAYGQTE